ncbi:MAG TPA: tRNA uridine-5-carboxymethylaminomethyl(34) synthesis GTPase MnmE [Rudaea sp.]|jgi:tRNA modification GTPase|nr:tRNA uridine-5-carboxymethylaminomethyl(34) synthesis GTPase MnmE [Rudaea sp.]
MIPTDDTIAAIATPQGAGGIGVVRVSGPNARAIAIALTGKKPKPRIFHFSTFRGDAEETIDRGLSLFFKAPRSFTGEDILELHAHGSPVVLDMLLSRVCTLGARHARPGEFSERAFLNGKIDLPQAEAIADLIAAGSEAAARAAIRSLEGEFSKRVVAIFDQLVRLRAWLEAALDFPEEEIDFLSAPQLSEELSSLRTVTRDLLAAAQRGVVLRNGLHVVIVGRPNAGKSSLLNALAQSERAIVTAIPGTTRDVLREEVKLGSAAITLVDTAGLRDAGDDVEREGIRRARAELAQADVVLLVTDSTSIEADRILLRDVAASVARLIVCNKIDLDDEQARIERGGASESRVYLSARSGDGIHLLRNELARLAGDTESNEGAFTARVRHVRALQIVSEQLQRADEHLKSRIGELAAEELRGAQQTLGEVTGEFHSDDLLGAIFSTFCIGK